MTGGSVMPPRPLQPRAAVRPTGSRPVREPTVSDSARRLKVLQSSRAPAQLSLFATPEPVELR